MKNNYKLSEEFNYWSEEICKNFTFIKNLFSNKDKLKFLEIGILEGKTTVWLLENILIDNNSSITCIEPKFNENAKHNLSFFKDKVTVIELPSYLALLKLNNEILFEKVERFDFIYIDGDHNAHSVLQDAILSWKILKEGGILLFDDYEMPVLSPFILFESHKEFSNPKIRFIHPKLAIDSFLSIYRGLYEVIIDNYQIGLRKITDFSSDYKIPKHSNTEF